MLNKIMNDKEISAIIEHINNIIIVNNCGCHGMGHAKRVMNYVEILLRGIGASDHEIELGKIAAYLHDIGAIMGKLGHAERSADYVLTYLNKIGMTDEDIHIIEHAIRNHSTGANLESVVGATLTFADKIDISKDRMMRFITGIPYHDNVKHILKVDLSVDNDNIYVNLITDGLFDYSGLKEQSKVIIKPTEMSKYLNRKCIFMIDSKEIDLYSFVTQSNMEKSYK